MCLECCAGLVLACKLILWAWRFGNVVCTVSSCRCHTLLEFWVCSILGMYIDPMHFVILLEELSMISVWNLWTQALTVISLELRFYVQTYWRTENGLCRRHTVVRKQVQGATGHKSCVNDRSTLHNVEVPIMDIRSKQFSIFQGNWA